MIKTVSTTTVSIDIWTFFMFFIEEITLDNNNFQLSVKKYNLYLSIFVNFSCLDPLVGGQI